MSSTRCNRSGIRRGALLGAATVVTLAFAVAGCGSPAGSATVASAPTGGSAPAPAASSPAPEVVTIQASEWAFTITGSCPWTAAVLIGWNSSTVAVWP